MLTNAPAQQQRIIPDEADDVVLDGEGRQDGGDEDDDKEAGERVVLAEVAHQERPRHGKSSLLQRGGEGRMLLVRGTPQHSERAEDATGSFSDRGKRERSTDGEREGSYLGDIHI